jgi:hypothetical protein
MHLLKGEKAIDLAVDRAGCQQQRSDDHRFPQSERASQHDIEPATDERESLGEHRARDFNQLAAPTPAARTRSGDPAATLIFHIIRDLSGKLGPIIARHDVQRCIDTGREATGGDELPVIDEAPAALELNFRKPIGERIRNS